MLAMIFSSPPQRAQPSISTPNTRFSRLAQLIATCRGVETLAGSASDAGGRSAPRPRCAGTAVAEGKEQRTVDGETYVLEKGLTADVAIVKAWKGDTEGNLIYRKTARNFNPNMATAAHITVAEVEERSEPGALDGDMIHTPGIYVQRIIQGARYSKPIEKHTVRRQEEGSRAVVA